MTALAADFDGDGWPDIYVASDSTAAILYRNNRDGTFTDVAIPSGAAYSENGIPQAGMGSAVADYDGDGRLDHPQDPFRRRRAGAVSQPRKLLFEDVATRAGLAAENRYVEWGAGMPDLDLDGRPDVVYVTGNVYPEVEARMPQYPHRGPRVIFGTSRRRRASRT